jgi:mono/diheme cytochrome c family protein
MKRHVLWICAAGSAVALLLLVSAASIWAGEAEMGKEQFMSGGCATCHSVASADIEAKTTSEKMRGPDVGGLKSDNVEELVQYIRKEVERDGKSHMKGFKGTDEELQAIIDWLGSLEAAE